ncbi:hypothetical protein BD410DRAFT_729767 [Rickenella mellea]|uniref:Polynucleotide 5'-hydroxyl-kinase GRC3 n=1 Tax=Rickenella mellea TaxID=50990 RepID=A0A4Y7PR82_9AGAM|nr:hypothetical protein BD410DRAFT_729767 [Rickenella mellea]
MSTKRKKSKRKSRLSESRTRYFQQADPADGVVQQDDVIVVDAPLEDAETDDSDDEDMRSLGGIQDDVSGGEDSVETPPRPKRAWSPSQPIQEISDDEENDESLASVPPQPPQPKWHTLNCSFIPKYGENIINLATSDVAQLKAKHADNETGTILAMSKGETVALVGTYRLTVLQGSIFLNGAELSESLIEHHIFAPRCSPIPVLTALAKPVAGPSTTPSWRTKFSAPIGSLFDTADVVLLLQELHTGVEGLGKVCRTFDGVFSASSDEDQLLRLDTAQMISTPASNLQPFHLPASWNDALLSHDQTCENSDRELLASQPFIAIIKGPRRTGKSTFARTLLNRLTRTYRRVAFLECDLGQTEFTPPGMVALHLIEQPIFGPPFCHPRSPLRAHFIGATSPRTSPSHYTNAIQSLLQTYRLEAQYSESLESSDRSGESEDLRIDGLVPLVVNTMGWVKGLGADLNRQIEDMVEPTHIFAMRPDAASDREFDFSRPFPPPGPEPQLGFGMNGNTSPVTFDLEPIASGPLSAKFTAADWRTISLMSYFHSRLPSKKHSPYQPSTTWNSTLPLLARSPFVVTPNVAFDSVVLVGPWADDVVPSEIGRVLNGAVVALVQCESGSMDGSNGRPKDGWPCIPYDQGSAPPDPQTSSCIGLALIRAVSPSLVSPDDSTTSGNAHVLHIVTPVPTSMLATARCMVKGEVELPIWGMLDWREFENGKAKDKERAENVPFLQWSRGEGVGADRRRVRRNLMRKAQM